MRRLGLVVGKETMRHVDLLAAERVYIDASISGVWMGSAGSR